MKNINSIFFSKYTRVLINGNECIVGNIAFDGRWIKMSHSLYKDLVQKSQNNISTYLLYISRYYILKER